MQALAKGSTRRRIGKWVWLAFVAAITAVWLVPAVWSLVASLRPETALRRTPDSFLPIPFTTANYAHILKESLVPRWFMNSLIVCVLRTALVLTVNSLAGYAFARIPFKGKWFVFPFVLAGLMVPGQATFIPVYLLISSLRWHNTYLALILPGVATPFGVFLLTQFFKGLPIEIEEAAMIDGAGRLRILTGIVLPLSGPVLATLGIFTFLGTWNDFLWPMISVTRLPMLTITVGLPMLGQGWGDVQFLGPTMAAAWIAVVPVMAFFLLFQRQLIRGISLGGGS